MTKDAARSRYSVRQNTWDPALFCVATGSPLSPSSIASVACRPCVSAELALLLPRQRPNLGEQLPPFLELFPFRQLHDL
jgi:hypothetical protein